MKKILTSAVLQEYCEEIYETPAFIEELNNYEKQAVLNFAEKRIRQEEKDIINVIIRANPDYVYPEEYKDRQLDYWKAIQNHCQFFNRIIYFLHNSEIKTTPQPEPFKAETFKEELVPTKSDIPEQEEENIFCKKMPLSIPKEHFKVFTEKKSKNGKLFLTETAFNSFIQKAFCGKDEPQQKFNYGTNEEGLIRIRFYEFYNMCHPHYENTSQCRDKYIKLLTDNFTNWEFEKVKNNFGKKPLNSL